MQLPMIFRTIGFLRLSLLAVPMLLALGMTGCATSDPQSAMDTQGLPPITVPILNVGDRVTINFSGLPNADEMPSQEATIKEDGTIALPNFERVQAAGKTAGRLETDIRN